MRIDFEQIELKAKKTGKCICGKRLTRQTTFCHTLNPFNKNDRGEVKTREEIYKDLSIEKSQWIEEPLECPRPTYWQWSKEQREQYNNDGFTEVKMNCGHPVKVINKNYKLPITPQSDK